MIAQHLAVAQADQARRGGQEYHRQLLARVDQK
jgi:hypothetical protein